jgi:NitT/TauT family transport system permease protein
MEIAMKKLVIWTKKCQTVLWILLILCVWEMSSRLGFVNTYLLPPFSEVAVRMKEELISGTLGIQILNSLLLVLEGFGISFLIALVISALCIYSRIAESFFHAVCTLMNPLPGMAVLPLIMMWFGVGNGAMIVLIVHGVLWPLVTNLIMGYKSVPQIYKDWGKNIGLSSVRMLTDIYLGAVISYLIAGLRVGWGRAWRALISAEMVFGMVGSLGGVGYYIYQNRAYANTTNVMVGIVVIVIIGVLVEQVVFRMIERNTVEKWGSTSRE